MSSNKVNTVSKAAATKSNKNIVENRQHLPTSTLSSGSPRSYDNCDTLIEVIVKPKGRKRTSTMVSSNPINHKGIDEKRRPDSSGDSHQSWGKLLRQQNKVALKQGMQQLITKAPVSKSSKYGSEMKERKKHSAGLQKQNYKHLDELPVKQSASPKRSEDYKNSTPRTANPSSTSIPSSVESITVYDKGVQCDGMFDYSDDRFGVFNPVRTLSFLIKELGHLVKDDKANKILRDMEQALFRIPVEPGRPPIIDVESMKLRSKLEATTRQLEETSIKLNSMCEALREERDSWQRKVQKHAVTLNEARGRQLDLETTIKTLKQELEEAIKNSQSKDKTITELTEEIKGYECFQKIIAELKASLIDQTELARQRYLEVQYLTLEKDKLSVLSSYKDSLLVELRHSIKELQNQIADQLNDLKDIYVHEESSNPHLSLAQGGRACSSPTSTSSRDSNIPTSWHDISDVSLSTIDHNPSKIRNVQGFLYKQDKMATFSESQIENVEKKRTPNFKESQNKDSANLDFISLPAGESSLTILPSYNLGCTDITQSVNKGKDEAAMFSHRKNDNLHNLIGVNKLQSEYLNSSTEKLEEKETDVKETVKIIKSTELCKKPSFGKKPSVIEDSSNILKESAPHNLINSAITEQFQNIFDDIRVQSRMPVNVPSPPRSYPHPDWVDTTLPSISTASELNVVQSNDK